jgi:hypothetical protein|tara:strand:+ start:35540 stop:35797 length:258 start_codon:yes stop_codon:yes gene_type:complete
MFMSLLGKLALIAIKAIGLRGAKKLLLRTAEVVKDSTDNELDDQGYALLKTLMRDGDGDSYKAQIEAGRAMRKVDKNKRAALKEG